MVPVTDATNPFPDGRAEPDQVSDVFFRNAIIAVVIGLLIGLGVFASVAWRGSIYDRDTTGGSTQVD